MNSNRITADTTVQDLLENPHYYGVPSFEDFKSNPKKYRKNPEHFLDMSDNQVGKLGKIINKKIWFMDGVRCDTPEKAQAVMLDKGLKEDDLQFAPELVDIGGQKADLHIHFRKKTNLILPGEF